LHRIHCIAFIASRSLHRVHCIEFIARPGISKPIARTGHSRRLPPFGSTVPRRLQQKPRDTDHPVSDQRDGRNPQQRRLRRQPMPLMPRMRECERRQRHYDSARRKDKSFH
jgi:hypothetical protein